MKNFRLPKTCKLINKADFKLDSPIRMSHGCLFISCQINKKNHARLGIIVSKRVAKLAVSRNRIKRTIRESFRLNQKKLSGYDIIVIAKQQCDKVGKLELREGIESLWQKLISRSQPSSSQSSEVTDI